MSLKILRKEILKDIIAIILGTRPGIIKLSPIIRRLEEQSCNYFIVHTGQHYSYEMDKKFFEDLELPEPKYKLPKCNEGSLHGQQTAQMLAGIESILIEEKPRLVLVGGDANTNLAGALAARKLQIEVGHIEAGLRSNDWRMPEEHNRVMIDHISEYLFAPTEKAKENLIKDNVKGKIYVTGNTIVDALLKHIEIAKKRSNILEKLKLNKNEFILITFHREENVDFPEVLVNILKGLKLVGKELNVPLIFPIHPRTQKRIEEFRLINELESIPNLKVIKPVGYLDFLTLLHNAMLVLTDSGGIQEESCTVRTPCVTLRDNTERQETLYVGSNIIAGTKAKKILEAVLQSLGKNRNWSNPFGDGKAAERIVNIILGNPVSEWSFSDLNKMF